MGSIKGFVKIPAFWLGIFISMSLITGLKYFQDFGISYDEPGIYRFTPVALQMYSTVFNPPTPPVFQREAFLFQKGIDPILFNYGPFYFMLVELGIRILRTLGVNLPAWDIWHLIYFLTFEMGLVIFYLLCQRWLNGWAALITTVLFATQPLIIGHAFMNPKDPPFMFFFIASIYAGLAMTDNVAVRLPILKHPPTTALPTLIKDEWNNLLQDKSTILQRQLIVLTGIVVLIILTTPLGNFFLQNAIRDAYQSSPANPLGTLLRIFSPHPENIPLGNFLIKSHIWVVRVEWICVLLIFARALWLVYVALPQSGLATVQIISRPFRQLALCLTNPVIVLAGIILGVTISIRLFAPLAGGIVVLYLLWKTHWRGVLPVLAYGLIALLTTYTTWPYLWGAPIKRIIKSLEVMREFSTSGAFLSLPNLLRFQYTEPAVILALLGIGITIAFLAQKRHYEFSFIFLFWTILPISIILWQQINLYDNFRQVLFLVPPFFMVAGLAIEQIIKFLRQPLLVGAFILLTLLPGIYSIIQLHPYEYVYYNQFAGGLPKAFRNYNMDYWGISFKEIARYLNRTAPVHSKVLVYGPADSLTSYLRPDFQLVSHDDQATTLGEGNVYLITYSQSNNDLLMYPQAPVIFEVTRDHAIFSVVKSLSTNP